MSDFETVAATENQAARRGPSGEPGTPNQIGAANKPRSLAGDAWRDLRRNPIFWISLTLVVIFTLMALLPGVFTANNPNDCLLSGSTPGRPAGPSSGTTSRAATRTPVRSTAPAPRCWSARSPLSAPGSSRW